MEQQREEDRVREERQIREEVRKVKQLENRMKGPAGTEDTA